MKLREKLKGNKKTLKRIAACVIAVTMLPFSDIAQADIISMVKRVYADEIRAEKSADAGSEEKQEEEIKILKLSGQIDDSGNVYLSWYKTQEYDSSIYRIYRNGNMLAETSKASYEDCDTKAGEVYHYEIRMYQQAEGVNPEVPDDGLRELGNSNKIDIQMPVALVIDGDYVLDKKMKVYSLDIKSGCLDLNGYSLEVCKNVTVDGRIKFNKGTLICNSDIRFEQNASCDMKYKGDCLYVKGDFVDSVYDREVCACFGCGEIQVIGNFTANYGMYFGNDLSIEFRGAEKQVIVARENMQSQIHIKNYSAEGCFIKGLHKNNNFDIDSSCKVTWMEQEHNYVSGFTVTEDRIIEDNLHLGEGILNLEGHTLTVKEDFECNGAEINLNGGTLIVERDMLIKEGNLNINNGRLIVKGDFSYGESSWSNTEPNQNRTWSMLYDNDYVEVGGYANLISDDKIELSAGSINIAGGILVNGNLNVENHIRAGSCGISNGNITISGQMETDACFYNNDGGIVMNKGRLVVYGFYGVMGMISSSRGLKMSNPEDYVCIYGDFNNEGVPYDAEYAIRSGTLELKGRNNKVAGYGDSKVIVSGDTKQSISGIAGKVEIRNSSVFDVDVTNLRMYADYYDTELSYKGVPLMTGHTLTSDMTIDGSVGMPEGVLDLNGYTLTINGTFYHLGGTVRLNGGRLNITEDYNIEEGYGGISPLIVMEQSADYLMIGGSLNVPKNEQCTLSDGVTEIKGDITGEGIIRSEQNHKVRLSGDKEQKITINRNSSFNVIEAENESTDGISMDRGYTINQFVRKNSGKIRYKDGIVGWTLKADEVYEGGLCISDGVLDLNGHTLRVKGSFIQKGGSIVTNNGTLIVEEDYTVSCMKDWWYDEGYSFCEGEKGNLTMQGKDSKIMVKGRVNINIETEAEWKLEAGRFCVGVDFYIASQPKISYSENFAWCLDGSIKQDISSKSWFYIENIIINGFVSRDDASAAKVTMHNNIRVSGKIESNGRYVENFRITDTAVFMDENFFGEVVLLSDYVINDTLVMKGKIEGWNNLTVNGKLKLDGELYIPSLVVNGTVEIGDLSNTSIIVNGKLRAEQLFNNKGQISLNKGGISAKKVTILGDATLSMNHADTYIEAEDFMCETKEVVELTEGFIRLTGHAQLNSNFITSGNNRMILAGKNSQAIRASEPVVINHLEIKQSSFAGVFIDIPVQINRITGNSQNIKQAVTRYTLDKDIVIDGDLYFHTGYINLNGHKMQVNGDFIHTGGDVGAGDGELNIEGNYYTKVPKEKKVDAPVTVSSSDVCWFLFTGNINIKGDADLSGHQLRCGYGTVTIGGNVRNYESNYSIYVDTVVFTGNDIELDGNAVSLVNNLVFRGSRVELKSDLKPVGSIDPGTAVFQHSVYMSDFHQLKTDTINADVVITEKIKQILDRDITVNGNLTLEGQMILGGHILTAENIFVRNKLYVDTGRLISRNNIQVGYEEGTAAEITKNDKSMLIMKYKSDYVLAEGNFTTNSRVNHYGYLTAGTLEVRGDFKQTGYDSNFVATGTHKTILSRKMVEGEPYVQKVRFAHPNSRFQTLILTRRQDAGYRFNTNVHNICKELTLCYDDEEPPSAVEGLTAPDVSETSITITYDKAADNINLLGYYIYRDGEKIADVKADITKYTDTDLEANTAYSYEVYAYDDCDNVSETSPKLDTRTKADATPPSVPTACSVVKRTGSSITLRWNPSVDNVKVAGYELYRNGKKIADITDGVSYKDTGLKAGTAYEYNVKAYDTSGNVSTFGNSVQTYVAMPEITRITPADNSSMGGNSVTLTLFAGDKGSSEGYYAEIYYRKKGGEFKILCESLPIRKRYDAVTFYEDYTWDISTLSDSTEYDIKCIIYDEDGNYSQKTVTYLLDREAPKKPKNVNGSSDNGVNIITFDASVSADCMGYHIYRKDKNSNVLTKYDTITGQYAVTYTDRNVIPGETYIYAVSAYDRFDNESAVTETVMIQTGGDYKKPEITGIAPSDKVISGIVNINVSATDNIGVESIKLWYQKETDGNKTENSTEDSIYIGEVRAEDGMASFSFDTSKLPDGAYIFAASAVDTSGNESDRSYTRRYETDNTGIGKIELTDCASGSTSVQLRWKDVEETDFAYFLVERVWKPDNQTEQIVTERIATVSDTLGYIVTGLKPDSTYAFWVVGYDKLGNRGIPSDICEITTQSDNIRPVISSILPVQSRYNDTLSLAMEVSDNDAVDRGVFSYSLDGENFERIAEVEAENKYTHTAKTIKYEFNLAELPEGTLYIRFEAYDIAGNKNAPQKDGTDIIAKYIVDRTPPSTVQNLHAESGQGYVMLRWEQGDEDAASFTICRAEGDTEDFQVIAENHGSMNYYDTAIVPGKTYRYKVAAADIAGNMGDYTQEVTCSAMKDEECPQIMSMLPDDGSIVGKNPNIKVFAVDNTGVSKITAEYRRAEDKEDIYRIFAEAEGSERSLLMDAALITDGLADGDYIIRAYCEDIFGNISNYCEKRVTLDSTAPDKPELVCESGGYQVDIKLKGGEEEDFSHYKIYRAELLSGAYSCIAETAGKTYTDKTAQPGILYCYKA
ncbi:MAG: fibronectin type III domain-containing protein, partial [Lachnospiraceae bacterium]|nr:fibronectin type III domain-containing protein [Lachnospiraceae bacterium]